ncbi:hypothetical protein [Nocardia sp. NPDC047038]|uniref:hypothetical protein n=1 Tax=Nocardia sp. NPDC047038 TaxID=3154338 RepID=UPI0033F27F9D
MNTPPGVERTYAPARETIARYLIDIGAGYPDDIQFQWGSASGSHIDAAYTDELTLVVDAGTGDDLELPESGTPDRWRVQLVGSMNDREYVLAEGVGTDLYDTLANTIHQHSTRAFQPRRLRN